MRTQVVLTLGDPRGIGPEVARGALARFRSEFPDTGVRVIGHRGAGIDGVPFEDVGTFSGSPASAGRVSVLALKRAVQLCLADEAHAVVTGPVHKPSLHEAGWKVPGQTELLQELGSAPVVGMLMAAERPPAGSPLRVLLATTHVPLRRVPELVTEGLLLEQTTLLYHSLRSDFGIAGPRIALCAFNPHASDGGLFGDEEARVYGPLMRALAEDGITVSGPIPADTVFVRGLRGEFDAIVAPYHDVGMAAFKTASFGTGVNVTLGLPFVRTSPDHGTAFDIAGMGRADSASMLEALRLAHRLACNRIVVRK